MACIVGDCELTDRALTCGHMFGISHTERNAVGIDQCGTTHALQHAVIDKPSLQSRPCRATAGGLDGLCSQAHLRKGGTIRQQSRKSMCVTYFAYTRDPLLERALIFVLAKRCGAIRSDALARLMIGTIVLDLSPRALATKPNT